MAANPDFRDMFIALNDAGAEYLVVGALAVAYHAEPRYSKDIDIWASPAPENAARVHQALSSFLGVALADLTIADLQDPEIVYQIGLEPNRIDILVGIEGVDFDSAWENRVQSEYAGIPVHILGKED
ncbi:hypothetical protein HQ560_14775, partial [bacterium]|nr:hypothetical protein [bacterium]